MLPLSLSSTHLLPPADFVQDLYLRELKAYKPKEVVSLHSWTRCYLHS